jgi:hypothetical protein
MPNVDAFMDELVTDLRGRLRLLGDTGDRRALEETVALLTDYRLSGMDEARFARLLATLRAGRSPVRLTVLTPQTLARALTRSWRQYLDRPAAPALS